MSTVHMKTGKTAYTAAHTDMMTGFVTVAAVAAKTPPAVAATLKIIALIVAIVLNLA